MFQDKSILLEAAEKVRETEEMETQNRLKRNKVLRLGAMATVFGMILTGILTVALM